MIAPNSQKYDIRQQSYERSINKPIVILQVQGCARTHVVNKQKYLKQK